MRSPFLLACLIVAATPALARAAEGLDFVVPPSDGYGIAECMTPGEACGQVIADAWCESHGHARATAFGLTDDATGSVHAVAASTVPAKPLPGSIMIHCGE
ncbi:hypothetical protein P7D22_13685 [Lichenihabitans sp. Uapishka_5]|uniref:hypothetical protein n=1 Tax=Lichenihabitans sp. Uapishka_5 TaxID=3037302 RepID=UPI0029E829A1|nr:hypothetical protein [Lichenihabitans sp. Uapishka_5]MDX7952226.1 hypothetical protein [Lichenihabitans sp. Uapishka_5]